jgi:hypothetical protein
VRLCLDIKTVVLFALLDGGDYNTQGLPEYGPRMVMKAVKPMLESRAARCMYPSHAANATAVFLVSHWCEKLAYESDGKKKNAPAGRLCLSMQKMLSHRFLTRLRIAEQTVALRITTCI